MDIQKSRGGRLAYVAAAAALGGLLMLSGCASAGDGAAGEDVPAPEAGAAADTSVAKTQFAYGEDVVIDEASITDQATYYYYDADGTTVGLLALRASDDSVRVALNTCQSCGGSPKAYFEQEGDALVCQNCGNTFPIDTVGLAKTGGCNPVPIAADECTLADGKITVPASLLDGYAGDFVNWKAGV